MDSFITRAEHEEFVKRMDDEHKRINKRLCDHDDATKELNDLVNAVGKLALNMENMISEIQSQGERLQSIEQTPSKNLNTFKNSIINAIGAVIGGAVVLGIAYLITL